MSGGTPDRLQHQLTIDDEERIELLALLQRALGETRVEAHRTHTPDFREQVLDEEAILKRLLEKLQRLAS